MDRWLFSEYPLYIPVPFFIINLWWFENRNFQNSGLIIQCNFNWTKCNQSDR